MKHKYYIIFIYLIPSYLLAQKLDSTINFNLFRTTDSVVLFWSHPHYAALLECTQNGYLIDRVEIDTITMTKIEQTKTTWQINPSNDRDIIKLLKNEESFKDLYEKPIEEQHRLLKSYFTMLNFSAFSDINFATKIGMRYVDKTIEKGKYYLYTLQIKNLNDKYYCKSKLSMNVDRLPKIIPSGLDEQEKYIRITWSKKQIENKFTGFYLQKSKDGIQYYPINKDKLIIGAHTKDFKMEDYVFFDSLALYDPHYYRIVGVSPYGIESEPSEPVLAMCRDKSGPGAPEKLSYMWLGDSAITIRWDANLIKDIAGYYVQRSYKLSDESWETIHEKPLNPLVISYFHPQVDRVNPSFYRVVAIDSVGNPSPSDFIRVVLLDSIPPSKPKGLKGEIDTNGIVKLTWDANKEADINGYYIYFTNKKTHMYKSLLGYPHKTNIFYDSISLQTHTEEIYYRISAVDFRSNYSEYSDVLELKKPDKVPPSPPTFYDFKFRKNKIQLAWYPSDAKDVVAYLLYKKNGGDWSLYKTLGKDITNFEDTNITIGSTYYYQIKAQDDAGLLSAVSFPASVFTKDNSQAKEIDNLEITYDKEKHKVYLKWDGQKGYKYAIYKSEKKKPLVSIAYTPLDQTSFIDGDLLYNIEYNYAIIAIAPNQIRSNISKSITIKTKKP